MMYFSLSICLCVLSVKFVSVNSQGGEGDICVLPSGEEGKCTLINKCAQAIQDAKFRASTKICGFNGTVPFVCCQRENYSMYKSECPPKTPRRPNMTFGRIAFEKCIEYQEEIIFPCSEKIERFNFTTGVVQYFMQRRGGCYDPPPLIVGSDGVDASRGQFPHMALLGYGDNDSLAQWGCGGTIISEWFILTAAHCTVPKELGPVTFARLGLLKRTDVMLRTRIYKIERAITHPGYRRHKYHDIALLKTEKRITFVNKFVSPACLDVEDEPRTGDIASATGWGAVGRLGDVADVLQIMSLTKFSYEECFEHYGTLRLLEEGIDNETQVCYGHHYRPTDTCKGDSGGPLQDDLHSVQCMHKVIGITSFGSPCGRVAQPGVYTRVRYYVPWIEAHVWPQG